MKETRWLTRMVTIDMVVVATEARRVLFSSSGSMSKSRFLTLAPLHSGTQTAGITGYAIYKQHLGG
jgi:hypothetical protein